MQCHSCGFENLPGLAKCGSCQAELTPALAAIETFPPRARDRNLRRRAEIVIEGLEAKPGIRHLSSLKNVGAQTRKWSLTILALFPGLSLLVTRKRVITGMSLFAGAITTTVLAALFYRHPISNYLAAAFFVLSICSLNIQLHHNVGEENPERVYLRSAAVTLGYIAALLIGYQIIMSGLGLPFYMSRIIGTRTNDLKMNDLVAISRNQKPERGDVVLVFYPMYGQALDNVLAEPGDRFVLYDSGELTVEEKPVGSIQPQMQTIFVANFGNTGMIPEGQYLLASVVSYTPPLEHGEQIRALDGQVRGVVTAILSPAERRQRLGNGRN